MPSITYVYPIDAAQQFIDMVKAAKAGEIESPPSADQATAWPTVPGTWATVEFETTAQIAAFTKAKLDLLKLESDFDMDHLFNCEFASSITFMGRTKSMAEVTCLVITACALSRIVSDIGASH